jgi:hypothetical protein
MKFLSQTCRKSSQLRECRRDISVAAGKKSSSRQQQQAKSKKDAAQKQMRMLSALSGESSDAEFTEEPPAAVDVKVIGKAKREKETQKAEPLEGTLYENPMIYVSHS